MTNRIRFKYEELASGQCAITSPDLKGFCVVAATPQDALDEALEMLAVIRGRQAGAAPERITAVEYEAA